MSILEKLVEQEICESVFFWCFFCLFACFVFNVLCVYFFSFLVCEGKT